MHLIIYIIHDTDLILFYYMTVVAVCKNQFVVAYTAKTAQFPVQSTSKALT